MPCVGLAREQDLSANSTAVHGRQQLEFAPQSNYPIALVYEWSACRHLAMLGSLDDSF